MGRKNPRDSKSYFLGWEQYKNGTIEGSAMVLVCSMFSGTAGMVVILCLYGVKKLLWFIVALANFEPDFCDDVFGGLDPRS